ncbi:MAG TPA: DNA polymerase III subunit alpha [bacterium]|nr:DNA polymerase III subunit alpha [bacterium]
MLRVAEFVHLHVHTEYSLLDGMIRIPELIERAETFQMPAVAMTDHGVMFGAVHFYNEAKKKGIKPIVGCEVYVAPHSRKDRDQVGHHLTLLCKNHKGYQNLCRMVSAGFMEGFYYKPRIDFELLGECNEGLIALSGCLKGEVASALLEEDQEKAVMAAARLKDIFTDNRFYLELMDNGLADQIRVNRELIALGKKLKLPVVATNDCHYLTREQARAQEVLLCIQTGKTMSDDKRMRMSTDEFYFRSPGEMKEKFAELPEAITNTLEIANRCNLEWNFEAKHFPRFPTEGGMALEDVLAAEAERGFEERLAGIHASDPRFAERQPEYKERLAYELSVIKKMGFAGYFMIVSDFINWAKRHHISVGPGRGSAAGSLVSYCLGITDLNPLAYGLIFERFLNPERREMPDIDTDFCQERREEVLKYVTERYGGSEYVAQIITFGTMKARAAVRDVGRVLGVPYGEVDRIAKLIPAAINMTLAEAMNQEPRLKEMREQDSKVDELLTLAEVLEGVARHASTHAAGVVISDRPLIEYLPLYRDPKEGGVVAQYDMKSVEKVGLIKFDLLGLKTLTQIRYCVEMIKENRGRDVDVSKLSMDDEAAYKLLAAGDTGGVFQLESSGMKDLLVRLVPNKFEELIAMVALYRPGPMNQIDKFIDRKHGREKVEYALPQMEEALKETYGVLVYQEQVMQIAASLAGYTMGEADTLRKAMGKKIKELMEAQQDKFLKGAARNKVSEKKAGQVWEDMAQFAKYGFNKSHAAAYAYVAYQTAWLKAHYPVEFLAALLTMEMSDDEKVLKYWREAEEKGIKVEPPHVNTGSWDFRARGETIRFGLGAVKGVGKSAVEAVVEARDQAAPFKSLFDFCGRADLKRVNRRTIENLIKAGAFDNMGAHRAQLLAAIDPALEQGHQALADREAGQTSLFDMLGEGEAGSFMDGNYPEVQPFSSRELLAHEKEALGFYLTGHPLARFEETMKMFGIVDTTNVPFLTTGQEVLVGGMVTARKEHISKKKERMAFITVSDLKGSVEVVVFASVYREAVKYLEVEDQPVLVRGRVEVSEDKAKILAGEIFPLDQATEKLSLTLHLTVNRQHTDPGRVEALRAVLKAHKGRAKVVVHVVIPDRSETLIALPMEYRANPGRELIAALREFFGEDSVRLVAA